jgi:tricorn protease
LNTKAYIQAVHAYSTEQDKSFQITDGLSEVSEPVFDESGKYLYFFGSTDAGPVKDWFAMSNADLRVTQSLYLAVLRSNLPNPLAKESDEEKGVQKEEKPKEPPKTAPEPFSIDFEGIENRILALPLPAGKLSRFIGRTGRSVLLHRESRSGPIRTRTREVFAASL